MCSGPCDDSWPLVPPALSYDCVMCAWHAKLLYYITLVVLCAEIRTALRGAAGGQRNDARQENNGENNAKHPEDNCTTASARETNGVEQARGCPPRIHLPHGHLHAPTVPPMTRRTRARPPHAAPRSTSRTSSSGTSSLRPCARRPQQRARPDRVENAPPLGSCCCAPPEGESGNALSGSLARLLRQRS